jgi:hypothetical protein
MQGDSMKDKDVDKLLSEHLSGSAPREALKQQALRDSTTALIQVQRRRLAWRRAELTAAAVLIAGIAFLGGRLSVPRTLPRNLSIPFTLPRNMDIEPRAVAETNSVNVPSDLVAWLDAARLFKRFGMEERMVRAFEHAGKLVPYDALAASSATGQALFTNGGDDVFENQNKFTILNEIIYPHEPVESMSGIIAQSFGGYYNESKMD